MKLSRSRWLAVVGIVCILSGIWVGWFGLPVWSSPPLRWQKIQEIKYGQPGFPELTSPFSMVGATKYEVRQGDDISLLLNSIQYRTITDEVRQAIIYLPDNSSDQPLTEMKALRHDLWLEVSQAILQHTDEKTLFLSWWDDAQRIDFLTGRKTWIHAPTATTFANANEQELWQQVAGPIDPDEQALRRLASLLAMDVQQALQEMAKILTADVPVYWLVCLDDLARVSEIERLSGKQLGFEARLFPQSGDVHSQIAEVKRWASENGTGSYLVQNIPGQGVRAWRIMDSATENTLLAKMLPFTSSLANPADNLEIVYQSNWGAYLAIYHWLR
ncbi:hydroxylamine oxidation protein HaoB [Methylomonas sp. AM2-LC]|uniref:hydroxylamine oxidation protein HaoB n=1 Tax=Methylomonas sp. AM2-LC TaxID=3153301 RepID=UPI003263A68A